MTFSLNLTILYPKLRIGFKTIFNEGEKKPRLIFNRPLTLIVFEQLGSGYNEIIGHFRVALKLIIKARLGAQLFISMKISFHSYANKTNFHMKSCAPSLAFITRFTATRKWPIWSELFSLRRRHTDIEQCGVELVVLNLNVKR